MTTHAISSGQKWPYVTHPIFEAEAELLINQTKAGQFVALHPLVPESKKELWAAYSIENLEWLREAYEYHGVDPVEPLMICANISMVFGDCVTEVNSFSSTMAPIWQIAPLSEPNQNLINFNSFNSKFFRRTVDFTRNRIVRGDQLPFQWLLWRGLVGRHFYNTRIFALYPSSRDSGSRVFNRRRIERSDSME